MKNLEGLVETIKEKVNHVSNTETIIGDAVTINDKTFFPLIKIRIGFGFSGGAWEEKNSGNKPDQNDEIQGGGAGGGIKISPVAMVYLDENYVKVLPMPKEKKGFFKLLDKIPDLFDKIQQKMNTVSK